MNRIQAIHILKKWDRNGKYVFTKGELRKLFFKDNNEKSFTASLERLIRDNILTRACRGIYIISDSNYTNGYTIEHIAKALRPGEYNYVSLESILSEYGVISQIPIDRLTVMTTGRSGIYKTTYGVIEYTHTKRSITDIINTVERVEKRPLRIASKQTAWRDLKRVGRNTHLVDLEALNEH